MKAKPVSAFEMYKDEKNIPTKLRLKAGNMTRKKQKKLEAKKLKKAIALTNGTVDEQNITLKKGIKAGKKKMVNGKPMKNSLKNKAIKKAKKKLEKREGQPSLIQYFANLKSLEDAENGTVTENTTKTAGDKPVVKGPKKAGKKKKINNESTDELGTNSEKTSEDRKAELKKKINKVKELVDKRSKNVADNSGDEFSETDGSIDEEEGDIIDDSEEMTFSIETFTGKELGALNCHDSKKQAQETFQWVIKPYSEEDFFSKFFEKGPLLVKRNDPDFYKGLFSTKDFDKILHEQVVMYSKNLDVTSYSDGVRETHNPIGQAHAPVVWDYFNNGCSLRMLNPQTFHPRVWKCLSSLQEYFNSFCGANIYLTPPDTQGFAPHWDDIEAFILQLEGKKRWRVYKPRSDDEVLPDYSSPNLTQETIGEPILDTILEAGDLLYFPRGYIHQGNALEDVHSLHITLSTYQKNSWGHYLEKLIPSALSIAMQEDVEFRKGLPKDYLDYMGIVHMENESEERTNFKKKVCELVMRMLENAPYDNAVDQRGANFIHDCLPPYLTKEDKVCSAFGGGETWCPKKKKVINRVELMPDTPVRLIRGNCIRLVAEEENVRIYHNLENSREYHKEEPQFLEVSMESAPAVETLIHTYPSYVSIESLPLQDESEKMLVASGLWERGLLVTAHPLDAQYDD